MVCSRAVAETKLELRPELEFILCAARGNTPANRERAEQLLADGVVWAEVLASAIEHRLEPALDDFVRGLDRRHLPEIQRSALADLASISSRSSLIFLGEVIRLNGLFHAARIPAIPFKGPVLGCLAYPKFAHRTCVDLDFVLPQSRISEAAGLMQSDGYHALFDPAETQAGRDGHAPGQYAFASDIKRISVELHTERTLRYFSRPIDLDAMNARLISVQIGGKSLHTFSVEDLLVMLSVHGAKHFWERLAWIVDIAQLVSTCEVNWDRLLRIADETKSTRLLLLGLYLAHNVLRAPLPDTVLERAQSDDQVRWLTRKVLEQFERNSNSNFGVLPRALFRLRASDGRWQGLRQLIRLSMSPTESDRGTLKLPAFLSPLYVLVRPVRLLREYGFGRDRRVKPDLAVYEATPPDVIERMLHFADVSAGDVLYDLGCGDGRIVVTAAKKYGIRAVGVDNNPKRIAEARANAKRSGVEKLVQFVVGDAKTADVSGASVVAMFLGADGNLRLADRLRAQLRPGARIVSRDFQIYGWEPDRAEDLTLANGATTSLYLWTIKNSERESVQTASTSLVPPRAAASK